MPKCCCDSNFVLLFQILLIYFNNVLLNAYLINNNNNNSCRVFYAPCFLSEPASSGYAIERPTVASVSSEIHWQHGVNGIAEVPKLSGARRIRTQDHYVASPAL